MRRLEALNRLKISVAFFSMLSGCVSSVTSYEYADDLASDGLVYALPKSELVIQATYRLSCQNPDDPFDTAKIIVTDLALTSQVIPDQTRRFVIDPAELSNLTTSVQPAKFNFKNGMLTRVEYKADSQIAETLIGAVKLVGSLIPPVGVFMSPPEGSFIYCNEKLLKSTGADLEKQSTIVATRQAEYDGAYEALLKKPSEGQNLALMAAESRLVGVRATLKSLRDNTLVRTVAFAFDPVALGEGKCRYIKENFATKDVCLVSIEENGIGPLNDWYTYLRLGPYGTTDRIKWEHFKLFVDLALATDLVATSAADAPLPGDTGYRGIYYRRGVNGTVWVSHQINHSKPTTRYSERFDKVGVLQMGSIARLEMRNGPFEKRGFTVEFDDAGQLLSYEATSIAPAPEALETAASLPKVVTDAQTARLQQEIDILKKRKELIDAQTALDAAQSQ